MSKKFDVVIGNPPYQEEAQGGGHPRHAGLPPVHGRGLRGREEGRAHHPGALPVQRGLHAQGVEREDARRRAPDRRRITSPTANRSVSGPYGPHQGRHRRHLPRLGAQARPHRLLHQAPRAQHDPAQGRRVRNGTSSRLWASRAHASYRYTDKLYEDNPEARALRPEGNTALVNTNAFEQFSFLYHDEQPDDGHEYVRVLGADQERSAPPAGFAASYVTGPESFDKYKVVGPGGERVGVDN